MMRSGNPTLSDNAFQVRTSGNEVMTIQGTVNKTFIMLGLLVFSAYYTWNMVMPSNVYGEAGPQSFPVGWVMAGGIGGFILAIITVFKKEWSPFTAPLYALLEGLLLGAVSAMYELRFQGIVFQSVVLTFGTLFALLAAYKSQMIKVTENFKLGLFAATGGIGLIYLIGFVLSFFGIQIPLIHESGPIGIAFSVFVVIIAALNLVMDFDFIENAAATKTAPKYLEWYGAFGLMVTLIWLYLEILRLLSKLNSRR